MLKLSRAYFALLSSLVMLAVLSGCESTSGNLPIYTTQKYPFNTKELINLQSMNRNVAIKEGKRDINRMRFEAIRETATREGAQAGLAWQARKIDKMLENNRISLDQIFNFSPLILVHNVIPPVLTVGHHPVNVADDRTLRIADKMYKIEQQARFVTAPPHWRDYLYLKFPQPPPPDASMLPRTRAEARLWRRFVTKGWIRGIHQANEIFSTNISRLAMEFKGMILYRKLLAQHMVSPPYVAKTDLGVIGGGEEMTINDQVLRIAVLPQLQANAAKWHAQVAK